MRKIDIDEENVELKAQIRALVEWLNSQGIDACEAMAVMGELIAAILATTKGSSSPREGMEIFVACLRESFDEKLEVTRLGG